MDQARRQLLELLREKSFRYSPDKPFKLVSGRESPYYIDCRPTTHNAQGLALIGEIFFDLIRDLKVDAIGGLTMGADPLAHGIAMVTGAAWFSVRKEQKSRGREQWIEGTRIEPGTRVLLVDDVISTGGSTAKAHDRVIAAGAVVTGVIPMVDRGDVAAGLFAGLGVPFVALVTYKDLGIEPVQAV